MTPFPNTWIVLKSGYPSDFFLSHFQVQYAYQTMDVELCINVGLLGSAFPSIFSFEGWNNLLFQESFLELPILLILTPIYLVFLFEDSYPLYVESSLFTLIPVTFSQILFLHLWFILELFPIFSSISLSNIHWIYLLLFSSWFCHFWNFPFIFTYFGNSVTSHLNVLFLQLSHFWVFLILISVILS